MSSHTTPGRSAIFVALSLLVSMNLTARSQSQERHTWEFKSAPGEVKVLLFVDASARPVSSLEILFENGARPSLADETGFLHEVIRQLPALGVDPHTLRAITMRGFAEPEVAKKLALAALRADAWQSRSTVIGGAERVVEDLLNSLGLYDEFNGAFKDYGMVITVKGVEKVASTRCMDLRLSDPACTVRHNQLVPVGANLYFEVVNIAEGRPKQ
jgi:hypothetical protein